MTKRSVLDMSPSKGQTHEDEILPHEGARDSLNGNRRRRKEPDTIISSLPKREGTECLQFTGGSILHVVPADFKVTLGHNVKTLYLLSPEHR